MASDKNNDQQLKNFFNEEYHNLKAYVNSKIENDADRDAEDIIQDVALKIFSRKNISPINNVTGFVYHSIKNKSNLLSLSKHLYFYSAKQTYGARFK
jgi:DNA-directed RNA polymerase specialized sigma24 family protein